MGALLGRGCLLLTALSSGGQGIVSNEILTLVWFKRDLRILDHAPLTEAGKIGRVLPVYVIEPEVIEATDFDALHWDFIRESLIDLNTSLEELGVSLFVQLGEVCDVFQRLHQQFGFTKISAHEETGNALSYCRDRRLARWAQSAGVTLHVENIYGENSHHKIESCYKGLARSLKDALAIDKRIKNSIPSTKGSI